MLSEIAISSFSCWLWSMQRRLWWYGTFWSTSTSINDFHIRLDSTSDVNNNLIFLFFIDPMRFINLLDVNNSVYWRSWGLCIPVILDSFSWTLTDNWQKQWLLNSSTAWRISNRVLWVRSTFLGILQLSRLWPYWGLSLLVSWGHSLCHYCLFPLMLRRLSLNIIIHLVDVGPGQLASMMNCILVLMRWLMSSWKFVLPQTIQNWFWVVLQLKLWNCVGTIWSRADHFLFWRNTSGKAVILAPSAHLWYVSPLSDIIIKYLLSSIFTLPNIKSFLNLLRGFEPSVKVCCVRCSHLGIVYSWSLWSVAIVTK